uniref:JmjC domain-containing protein n=1 Tax=Mycena chlorophos TaxID=658473 RepID=A0ABQ0LHT8_MYCCL|nr:predicted protein [Mycena chlorophos]
MEVFQVDMDVLAHRTATELREDLDEDESEDEGCEEMRSGAAGRDMIADAFDSAPNNSASTSRPNLKRKRIDLDDDDLVHEDLHIFEHVHTAPADHWPAPSEAIPAPNLTLLDSKPEKQDRQRQRRRQKRKLERREEEVLSGSSIKTFCAKRTSAAVRTRVEINLDSSAARKPVASSGFVCLSDPTLNDQRAKAAKKTAKQSAAPVSENADPHFALLPTTGKFTKEEMEAMGISVDNWDGKTQVVYVDSRGRELAILCGQPRDTATSDWGRDVAQAGFELMQDAAPKLSPLEGDVALGEKKKKKKKKKRSLRRGDHRAETVGVGVGNGRKGPKNFRSDDEAILETLLASAPFTRIAGFSNCAPSTAPRPRTNKLTAIFSNFAPRLHNYYQDTMDALFDWDPRLRRIFKRGVSVFPSCTFNFGPQTVTIPHLDLLNLAWGWCFITAFGNFDSNKGGHLILWDLKRVIRFPPGATIAIPLALLRHSNVSIQQDETRFSFT